MIHLCRAMLVFIALITFSPVHAHEAPATEQKSNAQPQEVQITVQQIAENIHLLQGQGGNIAVWTGADGAVMIDADFAEVTPTVQKAVRSFTEQALTYLINTHWHGDHTGGNAIVGGAGAKIIAHDNVRPRLSVDNYIAAFDMKVPAQPKNGLPQVSFNDSLTLHMNDGDMRLIHIPAAHTDGDVIVHLPTQNIIHTGDLFFNGFYPFIDASTGGTMDGMIAGVDEILAMVDDETKIIPGHGPLASKADLLAYRVMLYAVRDKLKPMIEAGQTAEEIAKTNPLAEFDAQWGDGFMPSEKWLSVAIDAIKPPKSNE